MKRALRTGVGSLPHLSLDAAIEYAFRFDLPFVPQLPALNPNERMVLQALTGLIGFHVLPGSDPAEATYREEAAEISAALDQDARIQRALSQIESSLSLRPFEEFLPSQDVYRALRPFVWEASERGIPAIKIQIAGPWTCLEALISASGKRSAVLSPLIQKRIVSFCLARSVALIRYLHESGIQPWLFIDEPYLFTLQPKADPQHAAFLMELTAFTKTLRTETHRAGGKLGLHCCSDPL